MHQDNKIRCVWCLKTEIETQYHDLEWGVPLYDDLKLFEFLVLDTFQAGLSWRIILQKRENLRNAFDSFNPNIIANYDQNKVNELIKNSSIIRNKMKINATITNAQKFLEIKSKQSSFSDYIWGFSDGKRIINQRSNSLEIPTKTSISDTMSKDMQNSGFKFVGSTICYAFMQAIGMVNDHTTDCFRHSELL